MPVAIPAITLAVTAASAGTSLYLQSKAQADAKKAQKELEKRAAAAGRSLEAETNFENLQLSAAILNSALRDKELEETMAEEAAKAAGGRTVVVFVVAAAILVLAVWWFKKRKAKA